MLNRIGSKKVLASDYLALFPKHRIYIAPFFGAGGVFFQKPLSNHNFLNDIDEDVYNLFSVLKDENKREKFEKLFGMLLFLSCCFGKNSCYLFKSFFFGRFCKKSISGAFTNDCRDAFDGRGKV